jgi:hypothetical protein
MVLPIVEKESSCFSSLMGCIVWWRWIIHENNTLNNSIKIYKYLVKFMGFFFQGFSHLNPTQKIEKLTAFCKFVFAAGDTLGKVYIVTYSNGNEENSRAINQS